MAQAPKNSFQILLAVHRSAMSEAQRKRSRNLKPRAMPYPIAVERTYARYIRDRQRAVIAESWRLLTPYLIRWAPDKRTDAADDELSSIMAELERFLTAYYGTTYLEYSFGQALSEFAERLLGKGAAFLQSQVRLVAGGATIPVDYPWWQEAKGLWEQQNYSLIKGLSQTYIGRLNDTIINGLQSGLSFDEIVAEIERLAENISGPRARLIARDQIGKLNGVIAKEQFTYIGMETYYWMTSKDEKVRGNPMGKYPKAIPSHYIMDGLLCSWTDADVFYNWDVKKWVKKTAKMEHTHPGYAIACRCMAAPSWNRYLADIDGGLNDFAA